MSRSWLLLPLVLVLNLVAQSGLGEDVPTDLPVLAPPPPDSLSTTPEPQDVPVAANEPAPRCPTHLSSVEPAFAPQSGKVKITVHGSGFVKDTVVYFGHVPCVSSLLQSRNSIECTIAPHSVGYVDVRVNDNPECPGLRAGFFYEPEVQIKPKTVTSPTRKQTPLEPMGGKKPYEFTIQKGSGSIDSASGLFTAPNDPGTGIIRVTDADGFFAESTYSTYSPLSVSPDSLEMKPAGFANVTPYGGWPPYEMTIPAGKGTIDSQKRILIAPVESGTWNVTIRDSFGNEILVPYTVKIPPATVDPLAVGDLHSCALRKNLVYCWGSNSSGQLGAPSSQTLSRKPVAVEGLSEEVISLSAGLSHSCALTKSGAVECWGDNRFGQLGDGTKVSHSKPSRVIGLESGVSQLKSGAFHNCALKESDVYCWGKNDSGQIGDGTRINRLIPLNIGLGDPTRLIAAGASHTCAVLAQEVLCWGKNNSGQIGIKNRKDALHPTLVEHLGDSVLHQIVAGWAHTCAATVEGKILCWGFNGIGNLGSSDEAVDSEIPKEVKGDFPNLQSMGASFHHTCAVTQGNVFCWGHNFQGKLGDRTMLNRKAPVQVTGLTHATAVAVTTDHTCAQVEGGDVYCWGENGVGQLGTGFTQSKNEPTRVAF